MLTFSRVIFLACIAAGSGLFSSVAQAADLKISWEVENRFPFYRNPNAFLEYEKTARTLQPAARGDWILQTERKLQDDHRAENQVDDDIRDPKERLKIEGRAWTGWAAKWREDTCWDRHSRRLTNRDRCVDFILPTTHRVIATVAGANDDAKCQWKVIVVDEKNVPADYWNARKKINKTLEQQLHPCGKPVAVEIPYSAKGETDPARGGFHTILRVTSGADSKEEIIQVNDLLVVGMGDSFGAGVGNPDKPASIDWTSGVQFLNPGGKKVFPKRYGGDSGERASTLAEAQAEWLDIRCFRSQYGPQFRAALHLAVSLPHSSVTYIDLACNGARIIEGLLNKKALDSGYAIKTTEPPSQVGLASQLLCAKRNLTDVGYELFPANTNAACRGLEKSQICEFGSNNKVFDKYQNIPNLPETKMVVCRATRGDRFKRPIDALLLSIGGNDIGFAAMVADVLLDNQTSLQNLMSRVASWKGISHPGEIGSQRLELLNSKYAVLNRAFSENLPWRPGQQAPDQKKPVFLTAYPIPLDDRNGQLCGTAANAKAAGAAFNVSILFENFGPEDKRQNNRPVSQRMKAVIKASCALNLRRFGWMDGGPDATHIKDDVTKPGALCHGFDQLTKPKPEEVKIPWHFVGDFLPVFGKHGFCAHQGDFNKALGIPLKDEGKLEWNPDYHTAAPYASRERWLRTPNDAFVITNWQLGYYNANHYANLIMGATTTSMHPTAEGFAAMGDGILKRVTEYLCKERSDVMNKEAKEQKEKLCPLLTDKISAGETEQKNAAVQ